MAEVDNAAPVGAKEDGVVQPALVVPERAAREKLGVLKMHERTIPPRLQKRDVLDPHDPRFAIVSQENEIVTIKCGEHALALNSGRGQALRFFLDWY
jgi:hypothetical protein